MSIFKPDETQEILKQNVGLIEQARSGNTDKHELEQIKWTAISNHTEALSQINGRLIRLETIVSVGQWIIVTALGADHALKWFGK